MHFSDVHGNYDAFKVFTDELKSLQPDLVLFGGDVVGYYYKPNEILDFMRGNDFKCVLGNHDKNYLDIVDKKINSVDLANKYGSSYLNLIKDISEENLNFIRGWPEKLELTVQNKKILMVHGSPNDHLNGRIYPDSELECYKEIFEEYDYVLLGHTHHKINKVIGRTKIINSGSLGQQRDGKGCSYTILDLGKGTEVNRVVNYPVNLLEYEVLKKDSAFKRNFEVLFRKPYY